MLVKSTRLTPDYPEIFSLCCKDVYPPPGVPHYSHAYSLSVQTKGSVKADECLSIQCS